MSEPSPEEYGDPQDFTYEESMVNDPATPLPAPDRGSEALDIIASEISDAIAAHDSGEDVNANVRAKRVLDALLPEMNDYWHNGYAEGKRDATLLAPHGEAVAWGVKNAKTGEVTDIHRGPHSDFIGSPHYSLVPLFTHPAPAARVTEAATLALKALDEMRDALRDPKAYLEEHPMQDYGKDWHPLTIAHAALTAALSEATNG